MPCGDDCQLDFTMKRYAVYSICRQRGLMSSAIDMREASAKPTLIDTASMPAVGYEASAPALISFRGDHELQRPALSSSEIIPSATMPLMIASLSIRRGDGQRPISCAIGLPRRRRPRPTAVMTVASSCNSSRRDLGVMFAPGASVAFIRSTI